MIIGSVSKGKETTCRRGRTTRSMSTESVTWLDEQKDSDKPFFMNLSHKAVHSDFTPAERHAGRYSDADLSFLPRGEGITAEKNLPRWVRDQKNSWHGIDFSYHSDNGLDYLYRRSITGKRTSRKRRLGSHSAAIGSGTSRVQST